MQSSKSRTNWKEAGHWGYARGVYWNSIPCFSLHHPCPLAEWHLSARSSAMMNYLTTALKTTDPSDHELKPLKPLGPSPPLVYVLRYSSDTPGALPSMSLRPQVFLWNPGGPPLLVYILRYSSDTLGEPPSISLCLQVFFWNPGGPPLLVYILRYSSETLADTPISLVYVLWYSAETLGETPSISLHPKVFLWNPGGLLY